MDLFGFVKKKEKKEITSEQPRIPEIGEIKRAVSEPMQQFRQMPFQEREKRQDSEQDFHLLQPAPVKPKMMEEIQDKLYQEYPDKMYEREIPTEKPMIRIRDISEPFEPPIMTKARGPIYVKIEKFESALSDFESAGGGAN